MSGRTRGEEKAALKDNTKKTKREGSRGRPPKSPGRTKSPGRPQKSGGKRATSKSPVRKVETTPRKKSPARATPRKKSPSRIPRSELTKEPSLTKITTSTPILDVDTDSDQETKIPKPSTQIRGRTRMIRRDITPVKIENSLDTIKYQSRLSRTSASKEIEKQTDRIVHLKGDYFSKEEVKLIEYSDEDEIPLQKRIDSVEPIFTSNFQFRTEYGGMWGTVFLLFFLPLFTVTIVQHTITKKFPNFSKLSVYYDFYSYLGFFVFLFINFIISMFPFGSKPEGLLKVLPSSKYVANGYINFIISFSALFSLEFYGIHVMDYINNHYLQLTVAGILFASLLSIILFIKAHYVPVGALNVMGDTDSEIYNFFVGKEVAPILFRLVHMKIYLIRIAYIGQAILTTTILAKSIDVNKVIGAYPSLSAIRSLELNYTLIAACCMIYITVFDKLFFEKTLASTFELRHEGQGYLTNIFFISSLFIYGLIPKYIHDQKLQLNTYILDLICTTFFIGYVLNRGSNNQKYAFRVNPYGSRVSHLATVPTSQGRKLLCGGYWGVVRHPNYFGELLMQLSFAPFVCGSALLVYVLLMVPTLVYRASRLEYRARQKYEMGWQRYCQNVKKMFIPKIF